MTEVIILLVVIVVVLLVLLARQSTNHNELPMVYVMPHSCCVSCIDSAVIKLVV